MDFNATKLAEVLSEDPSDVIINKQSVTVNRLCVS